MLSGAWSQGPRGRPRVRGGPGGLGDPGGPGCDPSFVPDHPGPARGQSSPVLFRVRDQTRKSRKLGSGAKAAPALHLAPGLCCPQRGGHLRGAVTLCSRGQRQEWGVAASGDRGLGAAADGAVRDLGGPSGPAVLSVCVRQFLPDPCGGRPARGQSGAASWPSGVLTVAGTVLRATLQGGARGPSPR